MECVRPKPVAAAAVPARGECNQKEIGMSQLSRDQVVARVHPLDDATIAEIIATGATLSELEQACAFYTRDRASHAHEDVPVGRVGEVISIIERTGARVHPTVLGESGSTLS